tara:strand:- start:66 stop:320 length:255 start_codon:yes stop_codon:yes gene_type:complete
LQYFIEVMRTNVLDGPIPIHRANLRAMIDNVEVDDREIRFHGRRTVLEQLVIGSGGAPTGGPNFVRNWFTSFTLLIFAWFTRGD